MTAVTVKGDLSFVLTRVQTGPAFAALYCLYCPALESKHRVEQIAEVTLLHILV